MPRHPSEALMRLIVLSKTHAWGQKMPPGRTKDRLAPTHALRFVFADNDVFSDPSSSTSTLGRRPWTDPSIHDVIRRRPGKAGTETCFSAIAVFWWSQTGSNRRPHACKARALPTELWPQGKRSRELSSTCPAQVSHEVWWAQADSNRRPHAYQACALTN